MYTVVTTFEFQAEDKKLLEETGKDCRFIYSTQSSVTREMLEEADIVLGNVPSNLLFDLPKLKFMQLDSAGSDNYVKLPLFQKENAPLLANASGAYGVTISEFMVGAIIMLLRHLQHYRDNMHKHLWKRTNYPDVIYGKKALVIGLGDIGSNFAKRMNAFGCEVYAIRRTKTPGNDFIKEIYTLKELPELLPKMDFIGLCLPNSPETSKIINQETLSLMKPSAILVNVGRGSAIDCEALAKALKDGTIAGAALDVTDPEPLPENHPLWDCENCLITPHSAGLRNQNDPFKKICKRMICNLDNFLNNKALESQVDIKTGYRKL